MYIQEIKTAVVYEADNPKVKFICDLPKQVHEILIENKKMKDPVFTHDGTESIGISRKDWIYECRFSGNIHAEKIILNCRGLDTITDIWLNEERIGSHKDMYIPFFCDITGKIRAENKLIFYFYSPIIYLEEQLKLQKRESEIPASHYIRKAAHDYADFLGIKPYFCPIGIFDKVEILEYMKGKLEEFQVCSELQIEKYQAYIYGKVKGEWFSGETGEIYMVLEDPVGNEISEITYKTEGEFCQEFYWTIENPQLWFPAGYGKQPLYTVKVFLIQNSVCLETQKKRIGIKKIQYGDDFKFWINGERIRLWGANLVPINGISHCFQRKRAYTLIKRAKEANMNVLRFWGGGEPYPEELYDFADEEGLLVWTEFFHNYGMYPEEPEFMEMYREEAEYMTKAFGWHTCILLWSGGNECHLAAELLQPGKLFVGEKIFLMYQTIVERNCPAICFLQESPMGGEFFNDPRCGDMHGWNNIWYVPYEKYPVFFSENSRVSPPVIRSLKKYIPNEEDFWPEGFLPRRRSYGEELFPPAWMQLSGGPENYRCSPIQDFYDADSPEMLIYQCQAAHARSMKCYGEQIKRGKRDSEDKWTCQGELIWKLNDTWPQIFCGLLDYDLEPGMAYFAVKRVFEKIQVSFNIEDNIEVWGVNDSREEIKGRLLVCIFDMEKNRILFKKEKEVQLPPKDSRVLTDLDEYAMFYRKYLLYTCLKGEKGEILCRNYEFVDIERNLPFPDAVLSLFQDGEELLVRTDKYAHCIELTGRAGECDSGFVFEDNYFSLLPFETKRIKISYDNAVRFEVTAKNIYSSKKVVLNYSIDAKERNQ